MDPSQNQTDQEDWEQLQSEYTDEELLIEGVDEDNFREFAEREGFEFYD